MSRNIQNKISMNHIRTVFVMIFASSLISFPAVADVVRFKNGNTLEGEIDRLEDGRIVIDVPGVGKITVDEKEIEKIEESDSEYSYIEKVDTSAGTTTITEKPPRTQEIDFRRREYAESARSLYEQARYSEPSVKSTYYGELSAQPHLARAIDLYEQAISEAQKALEIDRLYSADEYETLIMKKVIQDARREIGRIKTRMEAFEATAENMQKEEERKIESEKSGFKINELGTTTTTYDY